MENSYEIPNLENQKNDMGTCKNHFLPHYHGKVYKEERRFSRANSTKVP